MLAKLAPYNKFLVALAGAVLTVVLQFFGNNSAVQVVVAVLTAAGVHLTPNKQ